MSYCGGRSFKGAVATGDVSDAKVSSYPNSDGMSGTCGAVCGCKKGSCKTADPPERMCESKFHGYARRAGDVDVFDDGHVTVLESYEPDFESVTIRFMTGFITGLYAGFGTALRRPRGKDCC